MSDNPEPVDIEVGARIRLRRREIGVSQGDLANVLGLTFQQVQKYERGSNRVSASMLVKIAARLETTVGALVGEGESGQLSGDILERLNTTGASELLEAFARIPAKSVRRALLALAEQLAYSGNPNSDPS
jgi:transcriptional regulator with XRE-family HTH domain